MATSFRPAAGQIVAGQFRLERKLGEGGIWSQGERMNLDDRLAGWMVEGSPYRLARDAEALVSTSNRSRWLEGHGIIDPTPLIAYVPK